MKALKIAIYQNPYSGNYSQGNELIEKLHKMLFRHSIIERTPNGLHELEKALQEDMAQKIDIAIVFGGDGSLNRVTQILAQSGIKVMAIPAGTANDLASELNLKQNVNQIVQMITYESTKKIDLIKINDTYMLTNGGIGLPYDTTEDINLLRQDSLLFKKIIKSSKSHIYSLMLLKRILLKSLKLQKVHIDCLDFPRLDKIVSTPIIMINNQSRLGGNFVIAPETINNDGFFNVTIFTHETKASLLKAIGNYRLGKSNASDSKVISFETNKIILTSADANNLNFFGDGENLLQTQILDISVLPKEMELYYYDKAKNYYTSYSLDTIGI